MRQRRKIPHYFNLVKHTNLWLRLAAFKHRVTYQYTYYRQREAMERFRHCKEKKPSKVIRKEIRELRKFWGCYPHHYFRYDLYRSDSLETLQELIDYIPEFFFGRFYLDPYYDNKFSLLVDEKCMTALAFKALDIPQPVVLGNFINGIIIDSNDKNVTPEQWVAGIEQIAPEKFLIKPNGGQSGKGIYLFSKSDGKYKDVEDRSLSPGFLKSIIKKDDFLIQEGVKQHPEINKIYPGSVNTLRMVTKNVNGSSRLIATVMRIGHDGSFVDNFSQNGIALGIDDETGQANKIAITERGVRYSYHPDTGYKFSEFRVPNWKEIKQNVLGFSQKLAMIPIVGWDICLTESGLVVLEANSGLGPDLTQMGIGGLREAHEIDEPWKYWRQSPKYRVEQYEKYV